TINAPVIGQAVVPRDQIVIGQLRTDLISRKFVGGGNALLSHEGISLNSNLAPRNKPHINFGGGMSYNGIDDRWRVSSSVRVYDVVVGYTDQLDGKHSAS